MGKRRGRGLKMKWIRKTLESKKIEKEQWHKWFAWFPVTIYFYKNNCVIRCWLEKVERVGYWYETGSGKGFFDYTYREITKKCKENT